MHSSDSPAGLFQGTVAFTGRLGAMKREEAFALVRQKGGTPRRGVTRKTSVLVVGELGWPLLPDGAPSRSLRLAKSYSVPIASERRFLEWAGRAVPDHEARNYSPDQIASLSRLPLEVVEQLAAFGLIDDRDDRYRFRDLAAARQVADLLSAGVALSTITRSLHEIRKWLPDAALSNMRLYPAAADAILFEHMRGQCDRNGQFVLPVDQRVEDPDSIFEEAQSAEEGGDSETAARLYRKLMRIDPKDPAAAFNLGNLLRASGRRTEAEAAYRAATKADRAFAEAWYNLADVLDDGGRCDEAVACLERALEADPGYVDAIFNLGLLQQRQERYGAAAVLWQRYLALDRCSSWAAKAKQALKYCEMQFVKSAHR